MHQALTRYRDRVRTILPRHEQGGIFAAEGYARATGRPGVVMATSGPGALNLVTGLADAKMDSVPLLCITGQAPRARLYKEDFQAIDIEAIAKPVAKWAVTVREPALVPRVFQQAFHLMRSGRPGPSPSRPTSSRAPCRQPSTPPR